MRSIYVSLACKYSVVLERLEAASGRDVRTIHVIGGGARNELLCQLTADMTGREVLAGPVEATALGNVLVQARAAGELGSLADMRAVVRASFEPVHYEPPPHEEILDSDRPDCTCPQARHRDPVLGLRRLRHALRRLPAAGPPARRRSRSSTTPPRSTA